MKTATNDNSMVLAKPATRIDAVLGARRPLFCM